MKKLCKDCQYARVIPENAPVVAGSAAVKADGSLACMAFPPQIVSIGLSLTTLYPCLSLQQIGCSHWYPRYSDEYAEVDRESGDGVAEGEVQEA